jgi:hypothetical protein
MVILAVAAGIIVLASGCGGSTPSGSSSLGESSNVKADVAYQQCMSSHGVPGVTVNAQSNGGVSVAISSATQGSHAQVPDGSNAQVESAMTACQHLLPGGQLSQAQLRQLLPQGLKYAACMRTHGVPDFPDPSINGATQIGLGSGINRQSSQFQKAQQACRSVRPVLPTAAGSP